jgi:2-(1,2-epoxy-1,2-dihydrophenyl)acetyl-CoA isomerase
MTADGRVTLERAGGVARVTLRRPGSLNALAGDMREQLRDRLAEAAGDREMRALIITGEGKAFCAGGDIHTMASLRAADDGAGFRRILHAGAECVLALQALPALTIAAINGVAAGAGMALALNCDLRIATPDARLIASWGRIGLAPDWGATHWLPQMLGASRAMSIIAAGGELGAEAARDAGLLSEIVEEARLLDRAAEIAAGSGLCGPAALTVRELVRKGACGSLERSLAAETEAQEELFESEAVARGLAAFLGRSERSQR